MKRALICAPLLLALIGCAAPQPVAYPNGHLKRVGSAQFERDAEACSERATTSVGLNDGGKRLPQQVARNALIGGAAGGAFAWGAGRDIESRALGGGAAGAVGTLVKGLFSMNEPDGVHQKFVERCLKKKGYEPIGWR